jgi:hypothetical protein
MMFGLLALAAPPMGSAQASASDPGAAIRRYCEPLLAGAAASQVAAAARRDGFRDDVVMGQPVVRRGELLVSLSDAPRVCFVQAPAAMSLQEGMALVDAWAARHRAAVKSPATRGPDGAPARAWSAPDEKTSLIGTQQTDASGRKVMNFILMPTPPLARKQ